MKKIIIIGLGALVMFSCKKKEGSACISADKSEILVGEVIQFTNCSENNLSNEWDFGDGEQTDIVSPSHKFEEAGEYQVRLNVIDKKGNHSEISDLITVNDLKITKITITDPEISPLSSVDFYFVFNGINLKYDRVAKEEIIDNSYVYTFDDSFLADNNQNSSFWVYKVFSNNYEHSWSFSAYNEVTSSNLSYTVSDSIEDIKITFEYELSY